MVQIDKYIVSSRKSIKIEVSSLGEVIVYAPRNIDRNSIEKFISSKEDWINRNRENILKHIQLNQDIINYKKILLLGDAINIVEENIKSPELKEGSLYIKFGIDYRKNIIKLEKFIKQYATEIIEERLNYFANFMQLEPNSIKFSNAKKRWGSCDSNGNILLNWRIIMLPPNLIDYIIVHELSHLIEMNHSYDFWIIVSSIIPDWKERRQILKDSNFILSLFREI